MANLIYVLSLLFVAVLAVVEISPAKKVRPTAGFLRPSAQIFNRFQAFNRTGSKRKSTATNAASFNVTGGKRSASRFLKESFFVCDGPPDNYPSRKNIIEKFVMLVNDKKLYFFYENFAIKMSLPILSRLFEDDVDSGNQNMLLFTRPPISIDIQSGNLLLYSNDGKHE